ncbi:MAG TPA: hypothetical protein DFK12_00430 [Gallionellaceae bacterium]|nr:hypothetical protein [Gallionellaceae bacterium]
MARTYPQLDEVIRNATYPRQQYIRNQARRPKWVLFLFQVTDMDIAEAIFNGMKKHCAKLAAIHS